MTLLDIIIPAHNEEGNLFSCVRKIIETIDAEHAGDYALIIVNDNSKDGTAAEITRLIDDFPKVNVRGVTRVCKNGFGRAVKAGIKLVDAEYFCLVMADASDDPQDIRSMLELLKKGPVDAIFTNRFKKGGRVYNYPKFKLFCNRLANLVIACLYLTPYTDLSNAFKGIRTSLVKNRTLTAEHFELTAELALIALTAGKRHKEIRISWIGREQGTSDFKVLKGASRYLYQVLRFLPQRYLKQRRPKQ